MGKGKLAKFADMASYPHVFEYPHSVAEQVPFEMKGHWREQFFKKPTYLKAPGDILVQNENMASSLALLSNHLKEKMAVIPLK